MKETTRQTRSVARLQKSQLVKKLDEWEEYGENTGSINNETECDTTSSMDAIFKTEQNDGNLKSQLLMLRIEKG